MARPHPALFDLATGRPMPQVRDFDALLTSAVEHRMHGLLWSRVEAGELSNTGEWQRPLAMLSLRAEAHHRRLWKVAVGLTSRLADAGVSVAHFKGITAEARWFDRMGERTSGDIDVLLDPGVIQQADEVVRLISPEHPLIGNVAKLAHHGHIQYLELMVDGVNVDLHFDLLKLGYRARHPHGIWGGFQESAFEQGGSLLVPSPELALTQRLMALNRDRFPHVLAYAEVIRIVRGSSIDWGVVDYLVDSEGLREPVCGALRTVGEDLSIRLPVCPDEGQWLRRRIWSLAWRPSTRLLGHDARRTNKRRGFIVLPALVHGRFLDAVAYWRRRLIPPREIFEYLHPDRTGPYWWRFVTTRLGGILGNQARSR